MPFGDEGEVCTGLQCVGSEGSGSSDDGGTTTTTAIPPGAPVSPSPSNNSSGININTNPITLSWIDGIGGIPDSFDIFLEEVEPDASPSSISTATNSSSPVYIGTVTYPQSSFSPSGIEFNKDYYWKVIARNDDGNSEQTSSVWNFKTLRPICFNGTTSPANLGTNISINADLSWSSVSGASSYDIHLSTNQNDVNNRSLSAFLGNTSSTNFALPQLTQNSAYYWSIDVRNAAGVVSNPSVNCPSSNKSFITISQPGSPVLQSPSNGANNVSVISQLSWSAPISGGSVSSYSVYLGTIDNAVQIASGLSPSTLNYTPSSPLDYSTQYEFYVEAVNEVGSTSSSKNIFTTESQPILPPSAPTGPSPEDSATDITINSAQENILSWDSVVGASGYDVYFGTNPSPSSLVAQNITQSSFNPGQLNINTKYYWKVVSRNSIGDSSSSSSIWNFTTLSEPPAPGIVSPLNGATGVSTSVLLVWQNIDSASSYNVYFGESTNPPLYNNVSNNSLLISSLEENTTYYWRVDSVNEAGSSVGEIISFTTLSSGSGDGGDEGEQEDNVVEISDSPIFNFSTCFNESAAFRVTFNSLYDPYSNYSGIRFKIAKVNDIKILIGVIDLTNGNFIVPIQIPLVGQSISTLVDTLNNFDYLNANVLNGRDLNSTLDLLESETIDGTNKWACFFLDDDLINSQNGASLRTGLRFYYTSIEPFSDQLNANQSLGGFVSNNLLSNSSTLNKTFSFNENTLSVDVNNIVSSNYVQINDEILLVSEHRGNNISISQRGALNTVKRIHPKGSLVKGIKKNNLFDKKFNAEGKQYRCFALRNTSSEIAKNVKVFFKFSSRNTLSNYKLAIEIPKSELFLDGVVSSFTTNIRNKFIDNSLKNVYNKFNYYKDCSLQFLSGSNAGQSRIISEFNNKTGEFLLESNFPNSIQIGDKYKISTSPSQLINSGIKSPLVGQNQDDLLIGTFRSPFSNADGSSINVFSSRESGSDLKPNETIYIWIEKSILNRNEGFDDNRMVLTISYDRV